MADSAYILFALRGQRYALCMDAVDRIVQRPELTEVPDAPAHLAGVFDLGGAIIPVLDLSILLSRPVYNRALTDSVIVLHGNGNPFGVIADEVIDVLPIPFSGREPQVADPVDTSYRGVIERAARIREDIVLILDAHKLCVSVAEHANPQVARTGSPGKELSSREQQVFRERTHALAAQSDIEDRVGQPEVVVVGLDGEYFGLPLRGVREFCEIRTITPVPCCPNYISGTMNLRGEILVVMDLRPILRGAVDKPSHKSVVVVEHNGIVVGLGIDEVYDVIPMEMAKLSRLPLTADGKTGEYLAGTGVWGSHALTILDIQKLLSSSELVVSDEV